MVWTKLAMKIMGLPGYHLSEPYLLPGPEQEKVLAEHMKNLNIAAQEGLA